MPAAAVTPAPEAYIKVVAVKKLVVGSGLHGRTPWWFVASIIGARTAWCRGCVIFLPYLLTQVPVVFQLACSLMPLIGCLEQTARLL